MTFQFANLLLTVQDAKIPVLAVLTYSQAKSSHLEQLDGIGMRGPCPLTNTQQHSSMREQEGFLDSDYW